MGLEEFLGGILRDVLEQHELPEAPQLPPRHASSAPSQGGFHQPAEPIDGIGRVMRSVVQVVALRQGFLGGMSPAWTGSGTIVDSSGVILTNCHVANPRAMGMSAPPADRLAIAITERSDQPPAISYFAEVVAEAPELDLAVLRVVADINGRRGTAIDLPFVEIGNSDELQLGDRLSIFGYPGIGGETVTFTSGNVSGFSSERHVRTPRAWIKTDATIAGGNSGGTAVNELGQLVGVPTQAAAGTGVMPVDARPVLDTNRDGRVDGRDTPMAVGGFINGLRPVNLAVDLLAKAGVEIHATSRKVTRRPLPSMEDSAPRHRNEPKFSQLLFSTQITDDGRPIHPTTHVPAGIETVYATFEHHDMPHGTDWSVVWMSDGEVIIDQKDRWDDEEDGRKAVKVSNRKGLPAGEYHLVLGIGNAVALEGKVMVGTPVDDSDSQVTGRLVSHDSGRGVADGVVIVLKPNASVREFMRSRDESLVFTSAQSGPDGRFEFARQIPKGQAYSLIAAAAGYRPIVVEGALRVGPTAPELADIGDISMQRD